MVTKSTADLHDAVRGFAAITAVSVGMFFLTTHMAAKPKPKPPVPVVDVAGAEAMVYIAEYAKNSAVLFDQLADGLIENDPSTPDDDAASDSSVGEYQKKLWDGTAKARTDAQSIDGSLSQGLQTANVAGVAQLKAKSKDIAKQFEVIEASARSLIK